MLCLQAWLSPLGCLSGVARLEDEAGHTILGHFTGGRLLGPVWLLDPDNVGHLYTSLVEEIHSLMKENYGLSQSLKVAEGKVSKIKNIANEKIKKAEEKAKEKDSIINSLKEEAEKKDAIIKKAKEEAEMKDAMIESLTKSLQVAEGKIKEAEDNFFSSVSSEEDGN